MEEDIHELTDEQLLVKKKELKKSKFINAIVIGFLGGIVVFGVISLITAKKYVIIIPLLFPIYFIYKMVNNSKKNSELERLLRERNLN